MILVALLYAYYNIIQEQTLQTNNIHMHLCSLHRLTSHYLPLDFIPPLVGATNIWTSQ